MDEFYGYGSYGLDSPIPNGHATSRLNNKHYEYHIDPSLPSFMSSYSVPRGPRNNNAIYGQPLVDLSRATQHNLDRLKTKLVMIDPCYEFGIENWHSNSRTRESEPYIYPEHATPNWESPEAVFADGQTFNRMRHKKYNEEYSYNSELANKFCHLCTTLDEHRRHLARRGISLKAKPKRKPRISYIAPPPTVNGKGHFYEEDDDVENTDILYKIVIRTGSKPDAGTTANVFIQVKGRSGHLKKRRLKKNMSVGYAFGRGTKETFYVKGPKLGELTNLIIEHDGVEKKHSWFLEDVEVTDMANHKTWIFPFRNWLSVFLGDGVIKRNIKAYAKDVTQQEYVITVWTGNLPLAGTDSKVFITLYGKEGVGPRTRLFHDNNEEDEDEERDPIDRKPPKGAFRKGKKDTFVVSSDYHGPLTKIRIEHDDSGKKYPDWFLEKIEIREADNEKVLVFPCGRWLSTEGLDEISYDLFPVRHIPKNKQEGKRGSRKQGKGKLDAMQYANEIRSKLTGKRKEDGTKYEVITETGDVRYAGTDANVYILIVGKSGKTEELLLDNEKNNFEKGMKDVFVVYAEDVGEIRKVKIRHDNTGVGSGWFLATVIVKRFFPEKEIRERMLELDSHIEDEALRRASEITDVPLSGAKAHKKKKKKMKKSSMSGSVMSLHSIQEEDEEADDRRGRRKSKNKKGEIDSDEDRRLRRLYQKGIGKKSDSEEEDSDEERSKSSRRKSKSRKKKKGSSSESDDDDEEDEKKKENEEDKKGGVFQNLGRRMSKFFGIGNEEEDKKAEEEKKEKERKEKKKKNRKDDSDDDKRRRKRINGKKKKLFSYNGVDQWVTDSDQDSDDSDNGKRRRKKKDSETESDSDDSDSRKKSKRRSGRKGKYGDDSESDGDRRKRKGKKKDQDSESEEDSEDEEYRHKRNKRRSKHDDSSDSENERKSKRRGRKNRKSDDDDSDGSSDDDDKKSNKKLYKEWRHNRVPYYDEYFFVCERWLATDEDDGEIQRQLKPKTITTFYKLSSSKNKHKRR